MQNIKRYYRPVLLASVLLAVGAAFAARQFRPAPEIEVVAHQDGQVRFIELGSDSCRSCKAMVPVMAELREKHAATMSVQFIDVWKAPEEGKRYHVSTIPTQILFSPDGKELDRHVGFWPAEAITQRLADLGYPQR